MAVGYSSFALHPTRETRSSKSYGTELGVEATKAAASGTSRPQDAILKRLRAIADSKNQRKADVAI